MIMMVIRDLVQFLIESELHEHGAYLVDSLIESNPMMKVTIRFPIFLIQGIFW